MKSVCVGVVLLMILKSCGLLCLAKVYTVGDSAGWSLNVDYSTWTTGKTFKVGDSLVFNYGSSHTVDEVSSGDYGTCTTGNTIASYVSSPTTVVLNTTGTHYFICGVVGHCSGGMKVSVPVTGSGAATPAPSGSGGSSSATPATPTPTPPTGTSSGNVPASTSATISPVVGVVFSLVSLVLNLVLS